MRASPKLPPLVRATVAGLVTGGALFVASPASAQIKEPGAHPKYSVELEPHFLVQWEDTDYTTASDGLGLGLRASIPVVDNGPVTTINNNFAIGFGLDWAHFGNDCGYDYRVAGVLYRASCSGDNFWLPVVAQWNFFFTPVVSAFGELGLGIRHASWNGGCNGNVNVVGFRCGDYNYTDLNPVFAVGARFHVASSFAITLRLGFPYFSAGGSFFL